jgi:hypothetical protein
LEKYENLRVGANEKLILGAGAAVLCKSLILTDPLNYAVFFPHADGKQN